MPRVASSVAVSLPPVPSLPRRAERVGEDFTVWGASSTLRSRFDRKSVTEAPIWITGYIVQTNLDTAPRCAVHPAGVADPPGCTAPVPAFWIGDEPNAAPKDSIKVLGWASNYAQLHDAIRQYARPGADAHVDAFWGIAIPNPLPARGAKVRVRGSYRASFTRASTGIEADPIMGLVTYESMVVVERAPAPATLPGMRP